MHAQAARDQSEAHEGRHRNEVAAPLTPYPVPDSAEGGAEQEGEQRRERELVRQLEVLRTGRWAGEETRERESELDEIPRLETWENGREEGSRVEVMFYEFIAR